MFLLQKRLKHVKPRLKEWNKKEYGNNFEAKKSVEGKCKNSTKPLSWRVLVKIEVIRQPNIIKNVRTYINKRRFFGDKNPQYNG